MNNPVFLTIMTDGSSKGNSPNSPASIGYVIKNQEGDVIDKGSQTIPNNTAPVAEYQALNLALDRAVNNFKGTHIIALSDNLNMVRHINNEHDHYSSRSLSPVLVNLHNQIQKNIDKTESFHLAHIFREFNTEADSLANMAHKVIKEHELVSSAQSP